MDCEDFKMKKITAIGEVLLDVFGTKKIIGGAPFNFIYHVNKFIGNADLISSVGDDINGNMIVNFMVEENVSTNFIQKNRLKPTGEVLVNLNKKGEPHYHIKENVSYDYIKMTQHEYNKILKDTGLFYFGSLAQRNHTTRESIQSLFNGNYLKFCDLNLRQSFYTKEIITTSLNACNILKLNKGELEIISELCLDNKSDFEGNVKNLMKEYNIDLVAVTLGEEGAGLFKLDFSVVNRTSNVKRITDTVGAGDAYSSVLAVGIMHNVDLAHLNQTAVDFAAEVCTVRGAIIPDEKIYYLFRGRLLDE